MTATSSDIADLIARTALRDRAAFRDLYTRTSAKLFGVTLRILRDRSEAEEALQEVYVKIWQRADRYVAGGYSPISWLVAVARNHALDIVRGRKPTSDDIDLALDVADGAPDPEQAMDRSERARIDGCLDQLEADKADCVRGAYLDGFSYDELVERHKVPLNTMRTWLRRSLFETERVSFGMSQDSDQSGGLDGDQVLVAEYALGLFRESAEEHAQVAARLLREPALARELTLRQSRLSSLDAEFSAVAPPPAVLARLESRLFGAPAASGLAAWWNSLALWRGLAGAALAVAVVAVGINLVQPRLSPQDMASQLVAALKAEGSDVSFVALYNPATGSVRLTALSGAAVPDKDFELWAIKGENAPISMGVIPIETRSEVGLPDAALKGFGEGVVLAITLEQKGGSPDGTPRGPIVAAGTATAI